jgi:predicted ATPase/class 3 adenylate cyclase
MPSTATFTFLFTDLEGSTRLWEQFPDAMRSALGAHDAILRGAIEASGGTVVKTTGDGVMAVFGGAIDAASASLAAQLRLASEAWGDAGALKVRMGIHCGQAEQRGSDYFGTTVNRAARIMAAGHGGQVLLSASAAALATERLPAGAGLMDLGEHHLKDIGRPEHLFQLVHPDLPAEFPPLATAAHAGTALPHRVAALIGRREEIASITGRLADGSVRLLTLTGPGGTGKTTLAIRVAAELAPRFRDGVSFVDLASAGDTNAVLVAIARAVGLGEMIDRPLLEELVERLRPRRTLLVLDNLEQVTESASVLAQLLRDCASLTVLATSREALHVRAEQVFPVQPLTLPAAGRGRVTASSIQEAEAVQLFVDRARVVSPEFELTDDNAGAVAEICARLDGLPLAIELAAARLRLFSPQVLRDRLDDRLGLLRSGPRDLPERQQTLRAAMDWSYELLAPAEQRLFELLAVFAGADVSAVEAVADDSGAVDDPAGDVLDGLAGLVEKSLLQRVDPPGGEPRVAMLQTIGAFAVDRLGQRPDFAVRARGAHARYYADVARRVRADLTGIRRETALAALDADVANLRLAWSFWLGERDLEQLDALAKTLLIVDDAHGWYLDSARLASDMLAVLDAVPSSAERINQEIALRTTLARALMTTEGYTPEVEAALSGALELFERGADARQQFAVLRGLASLYLFRAQFDEVERLGRQMIALGEAEQNNQILIDGYLLVATQEITFDRLAAGLEHLDRAIALFPDRPTASRTARVGNDPRVACLTTSAFTLRMVGRLDQAARRADAALSFAAALDHPFTSAYALYHAGLLRLWRGEPQRSLDLALRLIDLADEHEFRIWSATGTVLLGASQVELGQPDEGLSRISTGMGVYGELRSPPIFWPFLLFLQARAFATAGRAADGLRVVDQCIAMLGAESGAAILPEVWTLKGDLLLALATDPASGVDAATGTAEAQGLYELALDRGTELGADTARLRAGTRHSRLLLAEGNRAGAKDLLEPILAAFTEGFDTPDVREAQAVLEAAARP